jgi:hypothetical protein
MLLMLLDSLRVLLVMAAQTACGLILVVTSAWVS